MNRDTVLFTVIGLLTGFICGYVMHEAMAARQPRPGWAQVAGGGTVANPATPPGQPAAGAPTGGAAAGAQAAMAQVQQLAQYVRDNPNDAAAIRQLANLNYDIRNWQRAAELYHRYLELNSTDTNVMTDLGATYRFMGQPQKALEQFRKAQELAPDNWQSRYNEILVLAFDLQDLSAANSAMSELSALQPDNPDVTRLADELKKRQQEG